jgi:NhaP-type Na+/H+ or K+/H+ antiporter
MRGGISIVMVLATPATSWRSELLAVVLFTALAQRLPLPWALQRLFREGVDAQSATAND